MIWREETGWQRNRSNVGYPFKFKCRSLRKLVSGVPGFTRRDSSLSPIKTAQSSYFNILSIRTVSPRKKKWEDERFHGCVDFPLKKRHWTATFFLNIDGGSEWRENVNFRPSQFSCSCSFLIDFSEVSLQNNAAEGWVTRMEKRLVSLPTDVRRQPTSEMKL